MNSNENDLEAFKAAKSTANNNDFDLFKLKDTSEKDIEMIYLKNVPKSNGEDLDGSMEAIQCPDVSELNVGVKYKF